MDAQELRNLQEAYSQVYQVDEALGDAIDRAREKSAKKGDFAASARYRASYRQTKHGFDAPGKKATKQGIDKETGEPRPGNKWRRRAGKGSEIERNRDTFDENYDIYDIILSHLLDEGYADTQEAAEVIMVNMSEEWREEIMEGMTMKDFKANRQKNKRRAASADAAKRGHVGKEWYNSGRKYSPDDAKRMRSNLDDEERRTRHRSAVEPDNESDDNFSADKTKNPKKLRKQRAMGEHG